MAKEAPWALTLALGCAGWFVTHVVDRVTKAPTLEYVLTTEPAEDGRVAQLELSNLTRDQAFKDLTVILQGERGAELSRPTITPVQPADEGASSPQSIRESADFRISDMQPGSTYRLRVHYTGSTPPAIRISAADSIIRATGRTWETSFARYEFYYLLGIGGLLALMFVVTAGLRSSRIGRGDTASHAASGSDPQD